MKHQLVIDKAKQLSVAPRWYQALLLRIHSDTLASDYVGHYQQLTGTLYFPGLFKSHSLQTSATIAIQNTSDYIFYKNLNLIEGYDHSNNFSSLKLATIDYEYPIAHPDLSITALCYIQRIRMSHFIHAGDMTSAAGHSHLFRTRLNLIQILRISSLLFDVGLSVIIRQLMINLALVSFSIE